MSKTHLVKISDYSQALAESVIDMRVVVELPDDVLEELSKYHQDPIGRAKQVARDAVNQRWKKISPDAPPVAMHFFAVEDFSSDVSTLTPGYKPYKSPEGERGWIIHGPRALAMPPDDWQQEE